jgi:tetratricopeptide (TPR) repeat protein
MHLSAGTRGAQPRRPPRCHRPRHGGRRVRAPAGSESGVAAVASAYGGDLGAATALNHWLAEIAVSPTLEALHRYVAGEIDALAGDANRAEQHYEQAIALARASGATFASGIASIGLLSVRAGSGRVAEALAGYRELLDYWERTGGWVQQWTTLRNLARLLHTLGDDETALLLDAAADHAPDASAVVYGGESITWDLPAERMSHIRTTAATAGRARVLDFARSAIARHHAAASRGEGRQTRHPPQRSAEPG